MHYGDATEYLIADFERRPEGIDMLVEEGQAPNRYEAIRSIVASIAPNFVVLVDEYARPGQLAQGLSEWHHYLLGRCAGTYRSLTAYYSDGSMMSREEANEQPQLQTLYAIRRGVRAALNNHYRYARSSRLSRPSSTDIK